MFIILFSDGAVIAPATRAVNVAAARQIKRNGADIWTCATGLPGPIVEMNSAAKQGTFDVLVVGLDKIEIRQIRISITYKLLIKTWVNAGKFGFRCACANFCC